MSELCEVVFTRPLTGEDRTFEVWLSAGGFFALVMEDGIGRELGGDPVFGSNGSVFTTKEAAIDAGKGLR